MKYLVLLLTPLILCACSGSKADKKESVEAQLDYSTVTEVDYKGTTYVIWYSSNYNNPVALLLASKPTKE